MQALVCEEALTAATCMWSVSTTATAAAVCAALALGSWMVVERVCTHDKKRGHDEDTNRSDSNNNKSNSELVLSTGSKKSRNDGLNLCCLNTSSSKSSTAETSSVATTSANTTAGKTSSSPNLASTSASTCGNSPVSKEYQRNQKRGSKKRRKSVLNCEVVPANLESTKASVNLSVKTEFDKSELLLVKPSCKQFVKLGLNTSEIYFLLNDYVLNSNDLRQMGFPVESQLTPGQAYFYHSPHFGNVENNDFNENKDTEGIHDSARGYVLGEKGRENLYHQKNGEPHLKKPKTKLSANAQVFVPSHLSEEDQDQSVVVSRRCIRCTKSFFMTTDCTYVKPVDSCRYHYGKLRLRRHKPNRPAIYTCCQSRSTTPGCSWAEHHVWSGVEGVGMHGPFDDFFKTQKRKEDKQDKKRHVYAMDSEMVFTARGFDLVKVSLVALDGQRVYDALVKPELPVIDFNTRFSGITEVELENNSRVKTLRTVQEDLLNIIDSECLLIGHGLENDLRALRFIHHNVIDTAVVFPHFYGLPYRRSLKSLARFYLRREIQLKGHDSYEDALACVELMLWKIRKDCHESGARRP